MIFAALILAIMVQLVFPVTIHLLVTVHQTTVDYFVMTLTTAPHCLVRMMERVSALETPTLVTVYQDFLVRIVLHKIVLFLEDLVKMKLKQVLCKESTQFHTPMHISGTAVGVSVGLVVIIVAVCATIIILVLIYTRYGDCIPYYSL